MEPKIIYKEAFTIIGIELKTTTSDGRNFLEIPQFWEKVIREGLIDKIPDRKFEQTLLGICMDFEPNGEFSYLIAAEVASAERTPDGMVSRTIPTAKYAVFTARGKMPGSIQDAFKYIHQDWLPKSQYQRTDSADFELYDERCNDSEDSEMDIYIPILPS
ncbi:MAG: GyrI-like domain-containing protein [Desulfosarcina sp.]